MAYGFKKTPEGKYKLVKKPFKKPTEGEMTINSMKSYMEDIKKGKKTKEKK